MGNLSKEHTDVRTLLSGVGEAARLGDAADAGQQINAGRDLLLGGLNEHIRVEDDELFPVIAGALGEGIVGAFVDEHVRILRLRDEVLAGAAVSALPLGACLELCDLLESHTVREDEMLFPAARQALDG
jgi:hemerythrin-like domain-containing protein